MRILISNDDGIYSPGLAALAAVAKKFDEVRVVAPRWAVENDFVSMTPLRVELTDNDQLRRLQSAARPPESI